jgi:hypothetical protein
MRLVCLLTAAAFGLAAMAGDAHAQATPQKQMSDGQMESAGKEKKAAKPSKRAKKTSKKSSQ